MKEIKTNDPEKLLKEAGIDGRVPSKYERHLKDPHLLENLKREVQLSVVGEDESIKTLIIATAGKDVKNSHTASYNLIVNGPSGVGKDFVVKAVANLWPKEVCVQRTRISPTAFTYWHNSKFEPEWSWDGKILVLQDISEGVLNSDVFKVMQSDGSSATIVIKNMACDIIIKGKPVCIITTAKSSPNPELVRRNTMCYLDEHEDQTKAILKKQAKQAALGIIEKPNEELLDALRYLKRVNVIIPFADHFVDQFPTNNIIMRTSFNRFVDYIKASAALHQCQRKIDAEGNIIASGEDYNISADIFRHLTKNDSMIPLTRDQQEILAAFKEPGFKYSVETLSNTLPISDKWLRIQLDRLVELGILEVEGLKIELSDRTVRHYSKVLIDNKLDLKSYEDLKIDEKTTHCTNCTQKSALKSTFSINNDKKEGNPCRNPTITTTTTHTTTNTTPTNKTILDKPNKITPFTDEEIKLAGYNPKEAEYIKKMQ